MKTTHCKSCGAAIVFARTKDLRLMPIDAEPAPDGTIVVVETERGLEAFFPPAWAMPGEPRHKSHFATCPSAGQHRKPRPA